jgi:hypothetical protein
MKFEKNAAGAWESKPPTPPAFAVDPAKVKAFVELIGQTRVRSFEKGLPEARHGFGDPKQNLDVKLTWSWGAVQFNIGASTDNGATYYGKSGWLDQSNPVFTLDGAPFKAYKEGATGFAK